MSHYTSDTDDDNNVSGIRLKVKRMTPGEHPTPLDTKAHWQTRDKWRRQISKGVSVGLLEGGEARLVGYLLEHGYSHVGWGSQTAREWDQTVAWYAMWSERSVRRARLSLADEGYLAQTHDRPFFLAVTDKLLAAAVDQCWEHDVRRALGPERAEGMPQDFIDDVRATYESHETVSEIVERLYCLRLAQR